MIGSGRKPSDRYLYTAVILGIVTAVFVVFVLYLALFAKKPSGSAPTASGTSGGTDPETEASETFVEISFSPSSVRPPVNGNTFDQPESTCAYEERVGIAYSIDMGEYETYLQPKEIAPFLVLVNKQHPLEEDFVPENLVRIKDMQPGRPEYYSYMCLHAEKAMEAFLEEGRQYGIEGWDEIGVRNGYRSYDRQSRLYSTYFDNEVLQHPELSYAQIHALVQSYCSYPGTSEHQLGLSADVTNIDASGSGFDGTPAAVWMEENCYRFGFVKRYPENKQEITGIINESWHFRFVGRDAATEMHELGMCLEEYLVYKGIS